MEIKFIPIDYDYFDWKSKSYAKIIGRSDKGKRVCIIDACEIYFWAILNSNVSNKKIEQMQKKIEKIKIQKGERVSRVLKTELCNKNYLGKSYKAIKIFVTNFKDAYSIASKIDFKEVYKRREYDLNFTTKYILEKKLNPLTWYQITGELLNNSEEFGGIDSNLDVDFCLKIKEIKKTEQIPFKPKILAYDIETEGIEIGKTPILMISLVGENYKKVLTWKKKSKKLYVETLKDEEEMLEEFVKSIKKYDPDILVGYYSDGFDLPYLKIRAEKNKIRLNLGLDNSQPKFSRGRLLTGKIKGITHIDLLRFIRTVYAQYLKSETLSLNEVAFELLGEKKLDFFPSKQTKLKNPNWEDFFKYNLQDSILAYKLTEKLWPDLLELTKIVQEPLFNISRAGLSNLVENYIIHNLSKYNEIAEKHPIHEEIGKRREQKSVEGAFVFRPIPGLYENLAIFDFTSMHTSIIVSFNISKATLLEKKQKNSYESPELEFKNKKTKFYFSKKPGFFPLILKELFEKRKKFKQEYKKNPNPLTKARSNAFKLLSASIHGYQGFFGARYYSLEASASVLAFVRKFNKEIIEEMDKQGYSSIYADTDSVIFKLNKHTKKQTLSLLEKINKQLPGIMELDLEDFYKRGIWVTKRTGEFGAKKKYALINEKNKIKIRGFETVRRDWCDLARKTQNKILNLILTTGNEQKALDYIKKIIKKIKNREIPLDQLLIKTQLKKPLSEYKSISPHVMIAKKMQEQGIPIDIGGLITYYISENKNENKRENENKRGLIREKAKLPNEPGKYDIGYYLNNQVLPSVENIFEVFKVNIKEFIEGKKQKKLFEF